MDGGPAVLRFTTCFACLVAIGAIAANFSALASPLDEVLPDQTIAVTEPPIDASALQRVVDYRSAEAPGTIVIDTAHTYLYFVLGGGRAIRYSIGVGRVGFTWSGTEIVVRKSEWPDWYPPAEMLARQPFLPRMMAGGPGNPLGARAIYLGNTAYRIHGTNQPDTIGKRMSSGCIRMLNEDVIDLYGRVAIGTKVVVLPAEIPPRDKAGTVQARTSSGGFASTTRTTMPVARTAASRTGSNRASGLAEN